MAAEVTRGPFPAATIADRASILAVLHPALEIAVMIAPPALFLALAPTVCPEEVLPAAPNGPPAIDARGVLVRIPAAGLVTVDGPEVRLDAGAWAEWYGLEYSDASGRRAFVGAGVTPDWSAAREPVEPVGLWRDGAGVLASARAGALEVATAVSRDGALWILEVTLTNLSDETLHGILYGREWRVEDGAGWAFPPDMPMTIASPGDVARRVWMIDDLEPGSSGGLTFSYRLPGSSLALGEVEVPLRLFQTANFPTNAFLGDTNGVSFGDYDADGWIDLVSAESGVLARNVEGTEWELGADLSLVLPSAGVRYGSSWGDYDLDGRPDLGTEPRNLGGDTCLNLLHNLGGAVFENIAQDPELMIGQPCEAPAETICWGDVEDDGDLDLFLPVYPRSVGGPGNFFLENLGPTGPGGAHRFVERSAEVGLDNPPATARPEGAQFVDVDRDGDVDLYSNGVLYQNRSTAGTIDFAPMLTEGSGIGRRNALDEGAAFFDHDLDGDLDLFIVYSSAGVRFWENQGDGTFFAGEDGVIQSPMQGLDLGLSAEDWDNDGDVDFTTRQVFRRNRFVEDGVRGFTVAQHTLPSNHLTSATPCWGDWDLDGDLDCGLGNWMNRGRFYENTVYDGDVPLDQKPYVRVRVARDDPDLPRGLEVEYGARVEIVLRTDPAGLRREKFVASSHGYLNQNEYALHVALPAGPDPLVPVAGQVFDVVVDFPGRAERGVLRVDATVNPALGGIALADLAEREILVFRSGRVIVNGVEHAPVSGRSPRVFATSGGLALADPEVGLPEVEPAPTAAHWVGIAFGTARGARRSWTVDELVLDGQLADPVGDAPWNVALFDVTDPVHPALVHSTRAATSARNDRTRLPFAATLEPDRRYRCVALVQSRRASPLAAPGAFHGLAVAGGLAYPDVLPATSKAIVEAVPDPSAVWLALTFRPGLEGRQTVTPR